MTNLFLKKVQKNKINNTILRIFSIQVNWLESIHRVVGILRCWFSHYTEQTIWNSDKHSKALPVEQYKGVQYMYKDLFEW